MSTFKQELTEQVKAFRRINRPELEVIDAFAEEFRQIINDFDAEFGHPPTADDLLWIASEHNGYDITEQMEAP